MSFPQVSPKQSFPALESEVLAYWKANNTFQKSVDSRPEDNPYRFYDGPPFITGTPHYGSLLSSVVKDVVGRYWTMRGRRVDRVWGWDCHGLPIEEKVQKKLGLKSNREIEERGVKEFIDGCYEYTQSTSAEWDWYIDKIGRWVDMDRAYRTMDQEYMESVMWVFSQLWNKGLIYEGKRVSLYSWKLSTPISNFEVAMDDTYQEVNDPAITVKFELESNDRFPAGTKALAWTTTPWTIPANMALAVRNDIDYVLVQFFKTPNFQASEIADPNMDKSSNIGNGPGGSIPMSEPLDISGEKFIVAKNRAESVFKGKGEYTVIREFKGTELVGLGYIPPFPEYYYQKNGDKNHKVYHADFITDTDGTGIGHEAPEFGDVDFQLAKKEDIYISEAMDEAGRYTSQIFDYEGTHYLNLEEPEKGANRINIERMKANNTLFKLENITHRVPFCPRSGTPLMQKAQSSWFIDIQSQKDKLLAANEQINWFPEHLKFGRFAKGIESAPDWCISRTRFWGAPMPVWMGEDGEKVVVSSREEIFEKNKPYGQLTKLIVTRHAESDANANLKYDDEGLSELSEIGKEQAERLLTELKDSGVDIIITSPFIRAIRTAEPLAKALGIEIISDELLRETNRGNLTNTDKTPENHKLVRDAFMDPSGNVKIGETGESYNDIVERMNTFIEKVLQKYPGKTVFVVSHGYPVRVVIETLKGKKYKGPTENAKTETFILDVANKKQLNLHKPYIDSIFLAPEKTEKPKKVLGIHGMMSDISKESWIERKKEVESQGLTLDLVQFDRTEDPTYDSWKETFDTIDFSQYDYIYTVSLGGAMTVKYLSEKGIKVPKIVMSVPGISHAAENGNLPNVLHVGQELFGYVGSDIADEIIVIHPKDDNIVPYENGKRVANHLGARLISLNEGGHELNNKYNLIAKYIKDTAPKKVLGIHGFLRNESIVDFFKKTAENLGSQGFDVHCPTFEIGESVNYENWKKVFLDNIDGVDTVFAHSLGCRFSLDMIIKNQIHLKRLILIGPPEGNHPVLQDFYSHLTADINEIKKYVDEVIILHSQDDTPARVESAKNLIEKTGGNAVKVDGYGHFNVTEIKLIEGLIQHGTPLTRIPEVLDVWMDSGSMPYAQMHYPFENKGEMEASFPADFIAEYVGQVRAWFYVMHVLGVLLMSEESKVDTKSTKLIFVRHGETDYNVSGKIDPLGKGKLTKNGVEYAQGVANALIGEKIDVIYSSPLLRSQETSRILSEKTRAEVVTIDELKEWQVLSLQDKSWNEVGGKEKYSQWNNPEVDGDESIPSLYERASRVLRDIIDQNAGKTVVISAHHFMILAMQKFLYDFDWDTQRDSYAQDNTSFSSVQSVIVSCQNHKVKKDKITPSFTNVITTGVINGNDGRKMSKSYGNYPDPRLTIEKYGADPIRFYMLNSPLLSGGDMDFKEEQIIETVKGVMLPIWNTYSFFTTYANIDQWEHDETEVWYMRHAETTSNAGNRMSDDSDDPELTEKGREQARNAGLSLKEQGKNFDVIIHTGKTRTIDTARIVGAEIGFSGEYMVDREWREQDAGEYAGMTHEEMLAYHNKKTNQNIPFSTENIRRIYKEHGGENIETFTNRVIPAYESILKRYKGKKVLIVAHAGAVRPILDKYFGKGKEAAHFHGMVHNAEPVRLMTTPLVNELDRWILSRLQVLMGQVHDAMDGYDVSRACRAIVDYMDELTNWYVRLSRRRFWGSEMTSDKQSAYETLYTVLTETSKLLAPYMPFMSEDIFRGLTQRESVHLEYITRPSRHLVDSELNRDMEICEHIVSLGLALRSRKNIRVRQPLQSVTITKELSEYYQAIIRDELNVKEVRYENPEKLAKKICKPDARKIGPKYGKDVQKVIMEAKNGNFIEKENGVIDVGGFILEAGEYIIEYLPLEGVGDVEGGYGIVISLDTTITESLKLEGYARDIIRAIQEMRKEADYQVTDRIALHIYGERHEEILASYGEMIQSETLSSLAPLMLAPDLEKSVEVDEGLTLTLQIER